MLYPIKFIPVYKDYIWGGRAFEKFDRELPDGIIAESWEISSHKDGVTVVSNGEFAGMPLTELTEKFPKEIMGSTIKGDKFPLLIKLIDANDKLSVQVHPDDEYAAEHENGELGKNGMWYIISAKQGAKIIYDVKEGVSKEMFAEAVKDGNIDSCLKYLNVFAGDTINIPAGLIHAIGEGIVLAEVQQNSNTTYRVYDYDRVGVNGEKRPLHIEKAIAVIDFKSTGRNEKAQGIKVKIGENSYTTYKIANEYFSVELYEVCGEVKEKADGSKFHIYLFVEGKGSILYQDSKLDFAAGETILIPAALGEYSLEGEFVAIKSYVPEIDKDILKPLKFAGFSEEQINEKVEGLR